MKTAMEELIHDFENGKFNLLHLTAVEKLLKTYLDKEDKQIKDAWNDGNFVGRNGWVVSNAKEYKENTYGKVKDQK